MDDFSPITETRDIVVALRYVAALLGQLLRHPVFDALIASLALGTIPMLLTALYSAIRTGLSWHQHTAWHRRSPGHPPMSLSRGQTNAPPTEVTR